MDERLVLALWFALGVGLQVFVLIRGDWNWGRLALCIATGLIGMVPGKHEHVYQPYFHILFSLGVFAFVFALMFKEDLLPVVNEKLLLFYSLIFWFAFFSYFYQDTTFHNVLLGMLLIPSAASIYIAFVRPQLSFLWKLSLYAWFLCIVVSLGLIQFPYHHLAIFLVRQEIPWLTPLDCIVAGMAFLYLAVNIAYLYELVPIQRRGQSWEDRMKQWHKLTDLMTHRMEDDEPTHLQAMLLLGGLGGALVLIFLYHWLPSGLAINVLIVLPCLLSFGRNSVSVQGRSVALATAQQPGVNIGRNDHCPCGSGREFKHCCGEPGTGTDNVAR